MTEEISSKSSIHFDKKEILKKFNSYQKYQEGTITIIKWEDDLNFDTEMYIIKNKSKELPFIGVVNYEFKREGYCVNSYLNGDEYFGYYSNDLRNKHGLYIYKPILNRENKILRQYYFGLWENDIKQGRGIYLWLKEEKRIRNLKNNLNNKLYNPFDNFEKANFDAYIGLFEQNEFTKGTLIKKEENNYFVFHGFFNNLKKNGNNCFYYSANLEKLIYGKFEKNKFIKGYVALFSDEGIIKKFYKYNMDMDEINITHIKKLMSDFRNIIMSEDYFGIIFNVFKNAIKFKDNYLNDINAINTYKYEEFLDICKSYKKITIFNDIENIF